MDFTDNFHMKPDAFRKYGYQLIDQIADYMQNAESFPVLSKVNPGDIRASLPEKAPFHGESMDAILDDVHQLIMPGITHWQSPNWFAYFPANTSGPSILGELASAGLGVQGMLWATSPACTELETHVLDWLADMMALPEKFLSHKEGGGVLQDSASSAVLCALIAARERVSGLQTNQKGCERNLTAYVSAHAHSSVEKAVRIAGIGSDNLRIIECGSTFAMQPENLKKHIQKDQAAGFIPFFVSATIGTTSSNAIDPVREIGEICMDNGLWLHVDGAMSGTAAVCPEYRHFFDGLELADSYCFNPHKWMFTNFDCDCFYIAKRAELINALSILPEYLRNKATESGAVIDYRDWQIPLGRRFRALKLWFVIRYYGLEGLQFHVRKHVYLAQKWAEYIEKDDRFELMAPVLLNLVCFRHKNGDDFNNKLLSALNDSGKIGITHTKLNDKYTLRMSIGQTYTEEKHVMAAWQLLLKITAEIESE